MRRATPSLNAIRAFESAARHQSFTKAAEELYVSASAISQQVSQLEAELGILLFERVKQRLKITEAGERYKDSISSALDRIESATNDIMSNKGSQRLRIGALPSLATYWLIPRLNSFISNHPSISVQVVTLDLDFASPERSPNLQGGWIDAGLFFGDGHWPGLKSVKFMNEQLVPVVSPSRVEIHGIGALDADGYIDHLPLLQHSTRPQSWDDWFKARNRTAKQANGPSFEHFHMLISAAIAGLGVALVPLSFVESEIRNKQLVRLGQETLESDRAYYLIYPPEKELYESHRAFSNWLLTEFM